MDHLEAEHMEAIERYVLGDLAVSEVEEFERHFFDCPQCSEELRTLTIFQENARAVFAEPGKTSGRWPAVAVALAALVVGIFAGTLAFAPRENAQAVSAYLLYAQARGEETLISPAPGSRFYVLDLSRTWGGTDSSYAAVVHDASGAEKFGVPVTAADAIHVLVPTHQLAAGKYVLVMQNASKTELARFPFTLRFE